MRVTRVGFEVFLTAAGHYPPMGSLAAETRRAVDESPFLQEALRAGVVNFAAAARYLDVPGDEEAIATALRRYAAELPASGAERGDVRVRMESGVEPSVLEVGGDRPSFEIDSATAILATGDVDARFFGRVLLLLETRDIRVEGAGLVDDTALLVVPRKHGAGALRLVEHGADEQ